MNDTPDTHKITVEVSEETREQIAFLAQEENVSTAEMASRLLATEAEAQAGLARGPHLRKYMYR